MELGRAVEKKSAYRWVIPRDKVRGMRVDAEIFASETLLQEALRDDSLQQVVNVASLEGIVRGSLAMPDIHSGYGFCIGGVAAFDAAEGIVSPGGVGYDINCGVRLVASSVAVDEIRDELETIGAAILKRVPTGMGGKKSHSFSAREFFRFLEGGAREVVNSGRGDRGDLESVESGGALPFHESGVISSRALERGRDQLGTLGSGNHFIEVQLVEEIFDEKLAAAYGLERGTMAILVHTGSRGFGHQVASDYIEIFRRKGAGRLKLPDPQLIYARIDSPEGQRYLQALNAAANFAWANRQIIMEELIEILERLLGAGREKLGLRLLYDQAHNIAKFEEHTVEGEKRRLLVHRKGATRAFPPGHPELAARFRKSGQPVLIPGSMGSSSYVLAGIPGAMELTFGSSAHGAGRRMSRHQAIKFAGGFNVRKRLQERGVGLFSFSERGLKEEIPEAYKNIDEIVAVTEKAGISKKVARLRPLVVVKG